ncbi:MAG: mannosyltransferase family protein [Ktedonobacterales bacterium]
MTSLATVADTAKGGSHSVARRAAFRDALYAWLAHEVLVVIAMALSVRIGMAGAGLVHAHLLRSPVTLSDLLQFWLGWGDAGSYAQIATHGYGQPALAPYYPLLPLLERMLSPLTGGNAQIAGFAIANISALPAFYFLRSLVERETGDRQVAHVAVILAAFAPFSFFFAMGYTESLFLLLSLGVFRAAREQRWLAAGFWAALAALTRPTGVLLLLPIAIEAAERMHWRVTGWKPLVRPLIALALPVGVILAFWAFEAHVYGMPAVAAHFERTYYARWLDWPWYGPGAEVGIVVRRLDVWPIAVAVLDLVTLLVALAGCIALVRAMATGRRLPLSYVMYGWVVLAFALVLPLHGADKNALYSLPRYLLVDFPLCLAIAMICARRLHTRAAVSAGAIIACLLLTLLQTAAFAIA